MRNREAKAMIAVNSPAEIQEMALLDREEVLHSGSRYWAVKRAMDVVLSILGLILLWPLMLLVAIIIFIDSPGASPIFAQTRVGRDGKEFKFYKFRSMCPNAEKKLNGLLEYNEMDGPVFKIKEDPRITRVGKFIRKTSIDELPQLFNILKGDMSIVGPRPERVEHVESYCRDIPEFALRTKVKGGLTGYAQIYGKYNTSPYDKVRLDMMYIENYSLMLDIKLILMTIRIMLKKESTEGFEKVEETQKLVEETLEQVHKEQQEADLVGAEK